MSAKVHFVVAALILFSTLAPLLVTNVRAADCPPSCQLEVNTDVPASEGTVQVKLDGGATYTLNHTFSFAHDSSHSVEVIDTVINSPSGVRYVFKEWSHDGMQPSSAPTLSGNPPFPIQANYTTGYNGPFVAKFEKHYNATVRVVDRENRPISGVGLSILFANNTRVSFTTGTQGEVLLGYIPVGTYTVQVTYQNQNMGDWALNASVGRVDTIKLDVGEVTSGPTISYVVLLTIFGLAMFMLLLAIKVRKPPRPPAV